MMKKVNSILTNRNETSDPIHPRNLSRRQLVLTGVAAATAFTIVPRQLLGESNNSKSDEFEPGRAMVETHPFVQGEQMSQEYTVTVNGQPVPVYTALIEARHNLLSGQDWDPTYSFASVEFSGRMTVKISSSKPLTVLSIRPALSEIPVKLEGKTATFTLDQPGSFLIERNNNGRKDPLLLFANPIESKRPRQDGPGVIYYGPGRHNAGMIHLTSNQTLYIAGGAVVTGAVIAKGDNIRILGRGLLENAGPDYDRKYMILLEQCTRARIEGITIRKGSRGWTIVPKDCDGVAISNVKICGSYASNDDGIDPVNTRNMTIEDCFIRTNDDCLAFKGMGYQNRNCENITVLRTSLWSDKCCAILLGDESRAEYMRNITVKDCHVLYLSFDFAQPNPFDKKFLMLHSGEEMRMENVRFENIDIYGEGQDRNYIEMTCEFNQYSKTKVPGFINNVVLKDVKLTGKEGPYTIVIKGFDEQYDIRNVTFDNCTINGKPITGKLSNLKIGEFTKNIRFIK